MSDIRVELQTDAETWTDITSDVRVDSGIEITRGRTGESGQAPPAACSLTLNNRGGRYSPRNPTSDLYGKIGRNTPIRVVIEADATYDAFSQSSGTGDLSFTHTPAGKPTGVALILWEVNTTSSSLFSVKYGGVTMTRKLFAGFTLGSLNAVGSVYFLSGPVPEGPQSVVVDTASTVLRHAAVHTVTGGSGAELDATVIGQSGGTPGANPGRNLLTTKRSCLFGSLLSDLNDGSTITPRNSFTESGETDVGNETVASSRWPTSLPPTTYTVGWNASSAHYGLIGISVRAANYRFYGEVAEFPGRYELSGNDAWIPIEAAGILRRLGQGDEPSSTGLRAFLEPSAGLFRYWPLSGGVGTQYSLDIAPVWGQQTTGFRLYSEGPGSFRYGEPLEVSETGSAGSDTNYLGTGMALFHTDSAPIRADVANGYLQWAVDFVFQAPSLGSFQMIMPDYSGCLWTLYMFGSTDELQVGFTDPATGPIGFLIVDDVTALNDGLPHHVRFQVEPTGVADSKFTVWIDGAQISTGTQSGYRSSGLSVIRFDYARSSAAESWITLAHVAVFADSASVVWPSAADVTDAARGYAGELAGERIERILGLADISLQNVGALADTMPMGPQYNEAQLKQLRDAEGADMGTLAEPRDALGLLYRTHGSLYNQTPALTLQFDGGHVSTPFEPVDDDQNTRNDVTAVRRGGDSYRIFQETGPLSIAPPPLGVGRYKDEVTVNIESDDLLPPVAGWLLHLGTLDAARYPSITVNLAAPDIAPLIADALAVDVGDRIEINGAAAANIYDDLSLLVQGYSESIGAVEHTITYVCAPADRYEVFELTDVGTRLGSGDTTQLWSNISSTATSMQVRTEDGVTLWTTDPAQMPISIMVAGEEMTVTAISGTTPGAIQTFTVIRSVNGVVKAQDDGLQAVVRLKRRAVLAL
ncbi:hypothetical protein [Kribbella sp. DT2]|uniref:hypothetical protein n=1 Tax=Kribbella sp. DT2 TaxID=3393427 RepID=UPI003CF249F8